MFYKINSNLDLNDSKLLLVTPAIYQRYLLYLYLLIAKIKLKLLNLNVKKHFCYEANQSSDSLILQQEKSKLQISANFDPKNFLVYYSLFTTDLNTTTQTNGK